MTCALIHAAWLLYPALKSNVTIINTEGLHLQPSLFYSLCHQLIVSLTHVHFYCCVLMHARYMHVCACMCEGQETSSSVIPQVLYPVLFF